MQVMLPRVYSRRHLKEREKHIQLSQERERRRKKNKDR